MRKKMLKVADSVEMNRVNTISKAMSDTVHKSNIDEVSMCETLLEITKNLNLNGTSK
jgi:hypothetical protein